MSAPKARADAGADNEHHSGPAADTACPAIKAGQLLVLMVVIPRTGQKAVAKQRCRKLGRTQTPVRLPCRALEQTPDVLRGRSWVLIGSTYSISGTPCSLDEHLKSFTLTATARWIAVTLEKARCADLAQDVVAETFLAACAPPG